MRRSHEGINGVTKDNYSNLPSELMEFNYYYDDGETGHIIMVIPECLLKEAEENGDLDMFECPVPCKYVLENGFIIYRNHVIIDVNYNPTFGVVVDKKWFEI